MAGSKLRWQSKAVLLLVLPALAANVVFAAHWWAEQDLPVAIGTLGLSAVLGLVAWKMRSATPSAAMAGAVITASLMFASATIPFQPWRTALIPVLVLLVLTSLATRVGRKRKEHLGTAESRKGRVAAQVAANLGVAGLVCCEVVRLWLVDQSWMRLPSSVPATMFAAGMAALCEAAADTVSSEVGQVLNSRPRMILTLRSVEAGTDGAVSLGGTAVGVAAAGVVAVAGSLALQGGWLLLGISWAGGVFGLFFDSVLGATLEQRGWLNNDAVNFLSTVSAACFAMVLLALMPRM